MKLRTHLIVLALGFSVFSIGCQSWTDPYAPQPYGYGAIVPNAPNYQPGYQPIAPNPNSYGNEQPPQIIIPEGQGDFGAANPVNGVPMNNFPTQPINPTIQQNVPTPAPIVNEQTGFAPNPNPSISGSPGVYPTSTHNAASTSGSYYENGYGFQAQGSGTRQY